MRSAAATLDAADVGLATERARGGVLIHRDWLAADTLRVQQRQGWQSVFTEFDVVLCPASPTPAFAHDHDPDLWNRRLMIDGAWHDYADQLVWAGLASVPGTPATVLPIGTSEGGLPIGAQVIGPMFGDHTTIRFAELLEREIGGFTTPALA